MRLPPGLPGAAPAPRVPPRFGEGRPGWTVPAGAHPRGQRAQSPAAAARQAQGEAELSAFRRECSSVVWRRARAALTAAGKPLAPAPTFVQMCHTNFLLPVALPKLQSQPRELGGRRTPRESAKASEKASGVDEHHLEM